MQYGILLLIFRKSITILANLDNIFTEKHKLRLILIKNELICCLEHIVNFGLKE